jgi:hypothetical protein
VLTSFEGRKQKRWIARFLCSPGRRKARPLPAVSPLLKSREGCAKSNFLFAQIKIFDLGEFVFDSKTTFDCRIKQTVELVHHEL